MTDLKSALVLAIMALLFTPSVSLADHGRPHFSHDYPYQALDITVEEVVNTHGVLLRDGENYYSLWGVIPEYGYLKGFLEGNLLGCTVIGSYQENEIEITVIKGCGFRNRAPEGADIAVRRQVFSDNIHALDGMSWPDFLIQNGHGQPLCGDVARRKYEPCK